MAIKGCTVTIDGMGCQKEITKKIIKNGGDFIIAVKGNQRNLEQAIKNTVCREKPDTTHVMEDCGHGRIEIRTCKTYSNLRHIENRVKCTGLLTIYVVEPHIYTKITGKGSTEQRRFITNLPARQ